MNFIQAAFIMVCMVLSYVITKTTVKTYTQHFNPISAFLIGGGVPLFTELIVGILTIRLGWFKHYG